VSDLLSYSSGIAGENKFDVSHEEIPPSANSAADHLMENLNEVENMLLNVLA